MNNQYCRQIIIGSIKIGYDLLKNTINDGLMKLNLRRILAVICLCTIFGVAAANLNYAYAVTYDGQIICYARDWSELKTIINRVEKTASEALGYEFTLDSELTTKLSIGYTETADTEKLEALLLSSIPDIRYLYVLSQDNEAICAFEDEETAKSTLKKYIAAYISEDTLSSEFVGNVSIAQQYIRTDLLADEESAISLMDSALKIKTIEKKTVEEEIPYEVQIIDDSSMVIGQTKTQVEGENGRAVVDYKMTSINGIVTQTETLSSKTINEPVNAVVIKGTREKASSGTYIWPCTGEITSDFGYRSVSIGSSNHEGIDIADAYGTVIIAADGGVVIKAEYYSGYGKMVEIKHDNGDITYYAHLSSIDVEEGDIVKQGDCLGAMGCTGTADGTHLHFEYHPDGVEPIDPMTILP